MRMSRGMGRVATALPVLAACGDGDDGDADEPAVDSRSVVASHGSVGGWHCQPCAAIGVVSLVAAVIFGNTANAQPEPTGFPELAVGEWLGNGRAGGESTSNQGGIAIDGTGDFTTNMEFVVDIDGSLSGTWVLEGASRFSFHTPQAAFEDMMTHSSAGSMAGNSRSFSLGTAQVDTAHIVVGDVTYIGTSSDRFGPIDLQVSGIYCNDAWGEWIVSWNLEIADQGYSPSYDGDWHAVRQSADFSEREGDLAQQISQLYTELGAEIQELIDTQPITPEGLVVLPADVMWEYIYRLVDLHNALRNLTPCDRALIGDDEVEAWIYRATNTLSSIIENLLDQYDLGAEALTELVNIAAATGAIGEGSLDPNADVLQDALDDALTAVANDWSASTEERVSAAATRWQHGWPLQ